jgi:hypothetical protein
MKARWIPVALIAVPLTGAMAAGAIWGFPVFDDSYLVTTLREGTPSDFAIKHPDQPLYGRGRGLGPFRTKPRAGLVWIVLPPRGPVTLEPYCLEPRL